MVALIATAVFIAVIAVLLRWTKLPGTKTSAAIWLTFFWLWFASSRNPSMWLNPHGMGGRSASSAYDEGNSFDRNILTGLMLVAVIVLASRTDATTAALIANIPVLLFFVYCLVSVSWSEHPDISIRRWFRALGDVAMVLLILTDVDWVGAMKWVYTRLACTLIPLSILFFRYYPELGRNYSIHDGHVSVTGVTDDKNALGMICMLFCMATAWSMIDAVKTGNRNKKMMYGYGFVLAMGIYIISIAGSATATACLIQGGGVLLLASMPSMTKTTFRLHLIVGGIMAFSALNLFAGGSMLALLGRNTTLTGRTDLWNLCLTLVTNPLMGAGYESFWLGWRLQRMWAYISGVNQAHNGYLEIYLNLGWIGVIFLVTLLVTGYWNIMGSIRRQERGASLRLAFFVAACIYNCTEAGFKMVHPMWIAVLMVSTARPVWGATRQSLSKIRKTPERSIQAEKFANAMVGK